MMGWYLMYWFQPWQGAFVGHYEFVKIGVPDRLNEETRAEALKLARSIWSNIAQKSSAAEEIVDGPYLVWRSRLEVGDDLVVVSGAGGHQPDETAEYEYRFTGDEE